MAFDPGREKAVFFGGESPPLQESPTYPTKTWEWNGTDWAEFSLQKGDINGNGDVDISDVILCLRMAIGLDTPDPGVADMNMDGYVNISDVILVLRIAIGLA